MNHQPFRGWLLSDEELSAEQSHALKDHLLTCNACSQLESSWKEVQAVIDRSPQIAPAPGFVERWKVQVAEHQRYQLRQKSWITIGATTMLVISLSVLLAIQLWSLIQAPGPYLASWFERLMGLLSIFFTLENIFEAYSIPDPFYALVILVFLFGIISFMSVLWLATYRKISMARREA